MHINQRTYIKIQEVLAQIGGFINCFWIIAFAISYLHTNLVVISEIIMNVFRIRLFFNDMITNKFSSSRNIGGACESPTSKDPSASPMAKHWAMSPNIKNIPKSKEIGPKGGGSKGEFNTEKKIFGFSSSFQKLNILEAVKKDNFFPVTSIKKVPNAENSERIVQDYENLELKFLDYVYYYTGLFKSPEREKRKTIITEGEVILQTCLDVKYIIKKFYELEKLKQMLLSEEDLKKFAHFPKPELKITLFDRKTKGKNSKAVISTLVGKRTDSIVPVKGRLIKMNT